MILHPEKKLLRCKIRLGKTRNRPTKKNVPRKLYHNRLRRKLRRPPGGAFREYFAHRIIVWTCRCLQPVTKTRSFERKTTKWERHEASLPNPRKLKDLEELSYQFQRILQKDGWFSCNEEDEGRRRRWKKQSVIMFPTHQSRTCSSTQYSKCVRL
mgnify:CR=1 FL=1